MTNFRFGTLDQIRLLEDPSSRRTGAKGASPFEHPPLRGLWHQHYYEPRFLPRNPRNELESPEAMAVVTSLANAFNRGMDMRKLVNDLVFGSYTRRHRSGAMTGEWIVYAKLGDANYYLTLAKHREGRDRRESDERIFERVTECVAEFPELELISGR